MIQGIEVIDFHSNFPNSGEWFPDYNFHITVTKDNRVSREQAELWREAFNFPIKEPEITDDKAASDKWYNDLVKKDIERIVFVSDSSWFPMMYAYSYLEEQHRIMRFLRFGREEIEMILSGNARKLLKLDLS